MKDPQTIPGTTPAPAREPVPKTIKAEMLADTMLHPTTVVSGEGEEIPAAPGEQAAPAEEAASGATAQDTLIGTTVADRFRITSLLGRGGMGTVYLARQTAVGRKVVLKFIHPRYVSKPDLVARFHREALAASKLHCPNTIVLHDFGQTGSGQQYMAMEYLEGRTLGQVIKAGGALQPLRAVGITLQILASLQEAHEEDIVHRDLKPDNIMLVDRSGTSDFVKVLDFGIAKLLGDVEPPASAAPQAMTEPTPQEEPGDQAVSASLSSELTSQGEIFGSPGYMAPEQVLGKEVDHRADIYAVGVILYQLLCGHRPFEGDNLLQLLHRSVDQDAQSLTASRPELALPRSLDRLILGCLHKDPARRPPSAARLAQKLRALIPEISRQQQLQERALLELAGIRRRWPKKVLWVLPILAGMALAAGIWSSRGPDRGKEGEALAPGERLFVSAAFSRVPSWVRGRAAFFGQVRGVASKDRALNLAVAEVLAGMADVPPRYDAAAEQGHYRWDLQQVLDQAAGLQGDQQKMLAIQTYWTKYVVGRPRGSPLYTYDGYAHCLPLPPGLAVHFRRIFASLRYDRYSFLVDEAVRKKQCERARSLSLKVMEAIGHLHKKKEQKERLRFVLQFKLRPCPSSIP